MEKKIAGGRFTLEDPERKRKMEEDGGDAAEVQRKKVKRRRVKRTMPAAHKKKGRPKIQVEVEGSESEGGKEERVSSSSCEEAEKEDKISQSDLVLFISDEEDSEEIQHDEENCEEDETLSEWEPPSASSSSSRRPTAKSTLRKRDSLERLLHEIDQEEEEKGSDSSIGEEGSGGSSSSEEVEEEGETSRKGRSDRDGAPTLDISQKKRQIISKLMKKSPSPRKRLNLKEGMKVIAEERKLRKKMKEKVKESGWELIWHIKKWRYDIYHVPEEMQATILTVSGRRASLLEIFQLYFSDSFLDSLLQARDEEIRSNWCSDTGIRLSRMNIKQVKSFE